MIDPSPTLPAGTAFAAARDEHLLNVRASQMSLYAEQPDDFCEFWESDAGASRGSFAELFAPRALYARYLAARLAQARAEGAHIEHLQALVCDLSHDSERWRVATEHRQIHTDFVVLATGARQAACLLKHERVCQPWTITSLPADRAQELALIVGGGLSAIDALQTLNQLAWRGKIMLVTPQALLSANHVELHVANWPLPDTFLSECVDPRATLRAVRAQLCLAEKQQSDWRSVINALRPITSTIFQRWSAAQRAQFLRHLARVWNRHRHRAPPRTEQFVGALLASGRLQIQAGRVQKLLASDDAVLAEISSGSDLHTLRCNLVIDARGSSYRTAPLLARLADAAQARLSETGFGLCTDAVGLAGKNLYALGATCFGERLETTAVPELRVQAHVIARQIVASLEQKKPAPELQDGS